MRIVHFRSPLTLAALSAALVTLAAAGPASGTGFMIFQHGGRATGQAGAVMARGADPSAVSYNPAALVHLDGLQLQAGFDFTTPYPSYTNAAGSFDTGHEINFPPSAYLTWKAATDSRFAFGLGIDEPMFDNVNWVPRLFPGRFLTRREEVQISDLHLVSAYRLDDHWSVGAGVRYAYGRIKEGRNVRVAGQATGTSQEVVMDYDASTRGLGFDGSVQYKSDVWGFGGMVRSAETVKGNSSLTSELRPDVLPALPGQSTGVGSALDTHPYELRFETPPQATAGVWIAPYPELRVELDAALNAWSRTDNRYAYFPNGIGAAAISFKDRKWRDTLSLRLGVEGDLTDTISVFGGLAFEPTPVPLSTIEPGFSRGDAMVYALGASYNFPQISFDIGWSLHQMQSRDVVGQDLRDLAATGRYSTRDQAYAASVRWRFGKN
ncbi:MAG: outer membrane protein transport protein [Acidobacteriota bacterium]